MMYRQLLLLATAIGAFALNPSASPSSSRSSLCQSPECVHAASNILYNLHPNYTNIDPCTDFDQYVCGGWKERHYMRPDQSSIFTGTVMVEHVQTRLRNVMENPQTPQPADSDNFQKLSAAYDACLNESVIEELGTKPLDDMLAGLAKVYPTSSDQGVQGNLTDALVYLMKTGTTALVLTSVGADDRHPDNVTIFARAPLTIGLPAKQNYNDTELLKEYRSVAEQVLGNFGGNGKLAKDVVELETKLADITPSVADWRDVTKYYNPKSIDETESLLPQVSFTHIISELAPPDYETDRLIVGSPSYLKSLSGILKKTPRETVQAFFQWKLIQGYADMIEDPAVKALKRFNNKLAGKDPDATEERWRTCVKSLDSNLGWILSRFYVLDSFSKSSKELGDDIVHSIREQFVSVLGETSWMSPDVRELAIKKVENIMQKIGYPTKSPDLMEAAEVKQYYKNLKMSDETYFENEAAARQWALDRAWAQLGKPTNHADWGMTASTVNAYYSPTGNEIVFPAGIMQPPVFYGADAPLYLAYGAFGAVAGHELSHAFDNSGRHYDMNGKYTDWWDNKTTQAFQKRAQCFVDQYSNFTVTGPDGKELHVNGRLTLGENIADSGGIGASFHSWKNNKKACSNKNLPGLSAWSQEQLFFISYANWWCSKTTPEAAAAGVYTDPHAPEPARILGTMANSREFKEAFKCPNKEPQCKLW